MSQSGIDHQKRYFRSVDELHQTPEFEQFLSREFPQAASEFPEGVSRRRWLQMMGASLALGGVAGCRYNREEVAAFVMRPEGRIPGVAEYFATNFEWAGRSVHALVTSLEGRPVKVDGNADHPAYAKSQPTEFKDSNKKLRSAGSDAFTQASILSLYDQDRIAGCLNRKSAAAVPERFVAADKKTDPDDHKNSLKSWEEFGKYVAEQRVKLAATQGSELAILYEPTRSPSVRRVLAEVLKKYPKVTLVRYESVFSGNVAKALDAAGAGKTSSMVFDLDQAKVIVSLDADLLGADSNAVQYSRQFSNHRSPAGEWMNRLYSVESQYSVTGSAADFRLALQSSQIPFLLRKIEEAIDAGKIVEDKEEEIPYNKLKGTDRVQRVIDSISSDLLLNKGASVLAVGSHHSMAVQLAAIRINAKLGNIGKSVKIYEIENEIAGVPALKLNDFVAKAKEFKSLWVLPPNPVFSVAGDLNLAEALKAIGDVVYLSNYDDETADYCAWTVPATHPLEAWGDVQAPDGVLGIGQPMIAPLLVGSKSPVEFLSIMADLPETDGQKIVMETARLLLGGSLSERTWKESLHIGFVDGTGGKQFAGELKADGKTISGGGISTSAYELPSGEIRLELDKANIEVVLHPSDAIYDGRLGNNGWLQELAQPITKLTWDNAAVCSIGTANQLGLKQGELVALKQGGASVKLPVFVVPGHAEGSFTVNLGYGRSKAKGGIIAGAVGTNLASFKRWEQAAIYTGIEAIGTSVPYPLATTQDHFALEEGGMKEQANRAPQLVREGTLDEYKSDPRFTYNTVEHHFENKSLWEEPKVDQNYKWGMTIDLNKCTGCNACVIACQAENNVPIVGKEQVIRGREMHWLRIDRYFECDQEAMKSAGLSFTDPIDATIVTQPMACAHCETAPCEEVCPVAATVHTEEGINAMAYNRCIGTRYCGNNCPYKVRRFNYFNYNTEYGYFYGWQDNREQASQKLQSLVLNPEVTVRGRGVMEKCTYCIQRVQNGKIKSRTTGDGRVHDGDIRSACQDACSSQAIIFGDLNDKSSRVYQSLHDPRAYAVLEELNIKPRTLYLSRIRNVPKRLLTAVQLTPKRPGKSHGAEHSTESGHNGDHS